MSTEDERKKWTIEYAEANGFSPDTIKSLHAAPARVFTSAASLSRCALRGAKLKKAHLNFIKDAISKIEKESNISTKSVTSFKKIDPIEVKLQEFIEAAFDMFMQKRSISKLSKFDIKAAVLESGANNSQVKAVLKAYTPIITELKSINRDPELKEAYSHFNKTEIKALLNFYESLTNGLEVAPKKTRKPRKPRAKKAKSPEKLLKKFTYKNSDSELKVQSINPESFIGATELWVYNTETRKLGVFRAASEAGLTVSGSSIRNYDEGTSFIKKIRKPKDVIPNITTFAKVALRKFVESIRSKPAKIRGRIGESVLLLRAF